MLSSVTSRSTPSSVALLRGTPFEVVASLTFGFAGTGTETVCDVSTVAFDGTETTCVVKTGAIGGAGFAF